MARRAVIRSIQYLRGIAALMVVWQHAAGQIPRMSSLIPLSDAGSGGVHIFFVISGFIMLLTTHERGLTPGQFLRLRIIRVAPLYWLATLAMIACFVLAPSVFKTFRFTWGAFVKSLLFVPSWSLSDPGEIFPLLVPGWTLNYEMFFYALFAGTLYLAAPRRLPVLASVLGLLVVMGYVFHPTGNALAVTYTQPKMLEFAAGAALAYLWIAGRLSMSFLTAIVLILAGAGLILIRGREPSAADWLAMAGATCVLAACLQAKIIDSENATLRVLGDASYSIYLSHLFTLGLIRFAWVRVIPGVSLESTIAFMAVAVTASTLVGCGIYKHIEKPLTAAFRKRARKTFKVAATDPQRRGLTS